MIYTNKVDKSINPPTNQSCAQLPGRPDKQLLGEAKDNREQLCKKANRQDDSHKQTTKNH